DAATLRIGLNEIGNSVIMSPINTVEDDNGTIRWRVHVHVTEPDDAMRLIRPLGISENLAITPLHANAIDDPICANGAEASTEHHKCGTGSNRHSRPHWVKNPQPRGPNHCPAPPQAKHSPPFPAATSNAGN